MGKVVRAVHKYHWKHERWTSCGRYVKQLFSHKGGMDLRASDVDAEVTCLACSSRMRKIYEEAGAEKQSK